MAAIQLPKGLIVDLITPLSRDGDVDDNGLERHLEGLIPHVQAILVAGPCMGQGTDLSPEQREGIFSKTLLIVQSRMPVFVWISMGTIEQTEDMLLLLKKAMEKLNYTGPVFWVDTPLYYHSNRGLENHYKKMSSLVEESFILINDPSFIRKMDRPLKRINIRTSILKGLVSIEKIRGIIFSGFLERAYNYRKAVRSRMEFMIYDGDESNFLEHPSLNGVLSKGANLAPAAWKTITDSSLNLNGNLEDYPDRRRQIMDAGRHLNNMKNIYKGYGPAFFKEVLFRIGIIGYPGSHAGPGEILGDVEKIIGLMEDHRK